jgi:GDP-mannose transporter
MPVLCVLLAFEEYTLSEVSGASKDAYLAVVLTCFAGTVLSFTGMSLRSELSATSFTVLGIVCKMASTLLNEVFVEPEQDFIRLSCIAAVIVSSSFYRQAPVRKAVERLRMKPFAPN